MLLEIVDTILTCSSLVPSWMFSIRLLVSLNNLFVSNIFVNDNLIRREANKMSRNKHAFKVLGSRPSSGNKSIPIYVLQADGLSEINIKQRSKTVISSK